MKISDLKKQEIFDNIDNEEFMEEFILQLTKSCQAFINTHPIYFMDRDDYLNDLLTYAWGKLDRYDDTRGNVLTYCFVVWLNWFRMRLRKHKRESSIAVYSLDNESNNNSYGEDDRSFLSMMESNEKSALDKLIIEEVKPMVCEYLQMQLDGLTQKEIAEEVGKSQPHISRTIKANLKEIDKYLNGISYYEKN